MARKKKLEKTYNVAEMAPDELNAYKAVIREYMSRSQQISNEKQTLDEDQKTLDEEFSSKMDLKHFKLAKKQLKIQSEIIHKDSFDLIITAMEDPTL